MPTDDGGEDAPESVEDIQKTLLRMEQKPDELLRQVKELNASIKPS